MAAATATPTSSDPSLNYLQSKFPRPSKQPWPRRDSKNLVVTYLLICSIQLEKPLFLAVVAHHSPHLRSSSTFVRPLSSPIVSVELCHKCLSLFPRVVYQVAVVVEPSSRFASRPPQLPVAFCYFPSFVLQPHAPIASASHTRSRRVMQPFLFSRTRFFTLSHLLTVSCPSRVRVCEPLPQSPSRSLPESPLHPQAIFCLQPSKSRGKGRGKLANDKKFQYLCTTRNQTFPDVKKDIGIKDVGNKRFSRRIKTENERARVWRREKPSLSVARRRPFHLRCRPSPPSVVTTATSASAFLRP
uniref:Uncharacterized protein n=1 Tax=Cucumis melo TaxID=3656 RepID=A0A9I9E7P0_CUCME